MLESTLQAKILAWLRRQPGVVALNIRANGGGNKGVSDIVCCVAGQFVCFELKVDVQGSYKTTKPQEIWGRKVKGAGGLWFAIDSLDEVKTIVWKITNKETTDPLE